MKVSLGIYEVTEAERRAIGLAQGGDGRDTPRDVVRAFALGAVAGAVVDAAAAAPSPEEGINEEEQA